MSARKETACHINGFRGWRCILEHHSDGPCALVPKWWNMVDRFRFAKNLKG